MLACRMSEKITGADAAASFLLKLVCVNIAGDPPIGARTFSPKAIKAWVV